MIYIHTPIKTSASAFASSVWGRWRFISSPSKSALYGVQTHSLNLNVLWGFTLACKQKKSVLHAAKHVERWKTKLKCFFVGIIHSITDMHQNLTVGLITAMKQQKLNTLLVTQIHLTSIIKYLYRMLSRGHRNFTIAKCLLKNRFWSQIELLKELSGSILSSYTSIPMQKAQLHS